MRRPFVVLIAVAALAGSAFAEERTAANRLTKEDLAAIADAAPVMPLTLSALFEAASESFVVNGMTFIAPEVPNVIVARKNDDGTISTSCVSSEKAARAFMERSHRDETTKAQEK